MSRLTSSFGRGYYGGGQVDPTQVDPNLLFQAMSPYERTQMANRMSSPIGRIQAQRDADARQRSLQFQQEEEDRRRAIEEQYNQRIVNDQQARLREQAAQADFQRQQEMVAQQQRNSEYNMIAQSNLGVLNQVGQHLQERDDRAYRMRHPYLPGQSPYEQQDIRQQDFADQQEWQIAQKMLDQNIRKEDRYDTLKNQHLQEGWQYAPEDQAMLQKLDEQVKIASQKVMSGELTRPQFAKYMELVRKQKEGMFPTMPPQVGNSIANELYTDPASGNTFWKNKRADGSTQIEHAPGMRNTKGMPQGDFRKTHADLLQQYNETYQPDPKTGKVNGPEFRDFLSQRLGTLLPDDAEPLAAQMGIPYKRPSLQPGSGGNTHTDVINGTPPTAGPGNGGKAGYDAATHVTPEDKAQRMKIAQGVLPKLQDGSHPYLAGAYAAIPNARELHQKAANLVSQYQQTQNDDVWRELESVMAQLEKPTPKAADPKAAEKKQLTPHGNAIERAGSHLLRGVEDLDTMAGDLIHGAGNVIPNVVSGLQNRMIQSKTGGNVPIKSGNVSVKAPGARQSSPQQSGNPQLNLQALDTISGAVGRDQQQEEDPQILEYKIQELMDSGYSRSEALRLLGKEDGSMQRYQRKR